MKFFNKIKGFTLAEVMITLMIIGIISAIVIPVAIHSKPDENLIKFKKAHDTLHQVIKTLVESDKYYLAGDLGMKADGTQIFHNEASTDYFCKTIADLLVTKSVNCSQYSDSSRYGGYSQWLLSNESLGDVATGSPVRRHVDDTTIQASKEKFDLECKKSGKTMGAEIITTDDVAYYPSAKSQFGSQNVDPNEQNGLTQTIKLRFFSPPNQFPANYGDENGIDIAYKIYCIDIDGIPDNVTKTDCVNECPFGYGIRADGKILPGARAEEWLKKDISGKKEDEES
ncbi:MAG: prepilin-type N-terminal cleavage/methylation domain-containing protein [Candidatus Gastranaerophilales bacterium]|nr:prepilin-type N-terminal cleavage/methylation domain-containing protein [Candidatus Gastranaerophilales bacterium]